MAEHQKFLNAKVLNKIRNLDLKARQAMEGFVSGMHKSPYHGFSVEFAQHREYSQGDDLRHLDWKVFGRSDRLYLKEYELETNLKSHILIDTSESMEYQSGAMSKLDLACFIAASLGYLIVHQQDAVGLVCFDNKVNDFIPPSSNMAHMRSFLRILGEKKPVEKTDLGYVLHRLAERVKTRGLIIIISDLFDKPEKILSGLQHFKHRRNDVILFHIMDEHEVTFPFQRFTMFEGLEEYPELLVDPNPLREAYVDEVQKFVRLMKQGCLSANIDYELMTTDRKLDVALSKYLATRLALKSKRGVRR